jgi:O-glycosyl hydrolase
LITWHKPAKLLVILILKANLGYGKPTVDTTVVVKIDFNKTAQTIDNIGASACWFSEGIGKYWPSAKKEEIAKLLFSRKFDSQNNPEGIGLSAFRFNIGSGTAEQGDSSGIKDFRKRTECFLLPNGKYDWSKQAGYRFFLQKAHDYGVENLIAFSNSPPVQFTKNHLGYKTEKDYVTNIRADAYNAYAQFLATVLNHFDSQGLHFNYISPVNEPQWDWSHKYMEADQEGSPWRNEDIYHVVRSLDSALSHNNLNNKILITEAGMLTYLYGGNAGASHQIQNFFKPGSPFYLGYVKHVMPTAGGHSYFTESNDSTLVSVRRHLADTAQKYKVNYWETEYSMLANGYKEGAKRKRTTMDCALFLAKVINSDLTIGNATAWQFWNVFEPGNSDFDTRYYLIALKPNPDFKDGEFTITKNLWALGHYSLFIRPGMQRLITNNDNLQGIMTSAYRDRNNKLVVIAINYSTEAAQLKLDLQHAKKNYSKVSTYLTTAAADINIKPMPVKSYANSISLPARAIATLVVE